MSNPIVAPRYAFPPVPDMTFLDLAFSASGVRRYHMLAIRHEQSVADHSYRVAQVCRKVLETLHSAGVEGMHYSNLRLHILETALDHDLMEALTGDTPSHSKTPEFRNTMKDVEAELWDRVVDRPCALGVTLPRELQEFAYHVLKVADISEGYVFAKHNLVSQGWKAKWVTDNWCKVLQEYLTKLPRAFFPDAWKADWLVLVENSLGVEAGHV